MPIYIYQHPETGERKEIVQRMNEEHVYSEGDTKWLRVFISASAQIDTFENLNPNNKQAFVKKTASKGMTMGQMWDESKRLSEKRAKHSGLDPVRQKAIERYHHLTGKPHPEE